MTAPHTPPPPGSQPGAPQASDLWAQAATENAATRAAPDPAWERGVLEKLVLATVAEQRAARRWRIFWRFSWIALVLAAAWLLTMSRDLASAAKSGPHTAVVDIKGEIASGAEASAEFVVAALKSAFEDAGAQAVVLLINSRAAARCRPASSTTRSCA